MSRYLVLLLVFAGFAAIAVPASPARDNTAADGLRAICVAGGGSFSSSSTLEYDCTTTNLSGFTGWKNLCLSQRRTTQATWVAGLTTAGYLCRNTVGG
jgi:hypothetical protein